MSTLQHSSSKVRGLLFAIAVSLVVTRLVFWAAGAWYRPLADPFDAGKFAFHFAIWAVVFGLSLWFFNRGHRQR